ncbi:carbohydrate esterase family 4 protein [Plenodomus tracheiphilus IPT5]|uniref:Carbohydrate esterase family 4 protein n=1 Tax=Plenodomus tracheiphilus IPT5 TaxID=1408161 RepID=A0A6A7BBT0_9PLEO|nr:carbohydrate esterase family 4 protein [Plenodomus tracheiphilus IPT5]
MRISTLIGLVAGLATQTIDAACSGPLKIDDFSKYSSNLNSLGEWTSDDGSMTSIKATGGVLSFTPKSSSYFYESFPCQQASSNGYNSVTFQIKGPAGGTATFEIQTKTACSASAYTSKYIQLSGFTGSLQTMTIPLSQFAGANVNAVQTFVWSGFSSTTYSWQLSNIAFGCQGAVVPSSSKAPTVAPSSSKAPSSTKASSAAASSTKLSSVAPSSTKVSSSLVHPSSTLATISSPSPSSGTCKNLLIDDFRSQSRLTFMFYNAFNYPTASDGTMKSVTVGKPSANRVEFVPNVPGEAYFYSQMPCTNAKGKYGGISLRIKAPRGTTLNLQLDSSATCDPEKAVSGYASTADLGWTFDGTEKLYSIPFDKFPGVDLEKLVTVLFSGYTNTVSFGPMSLYCGNTVSEYIVPTVPSVPESSATVAAPSNPSASALVIDKFANADSNNLGFWHGGDEGMTLTYSGGKLKIVSTDADYSFYTQVSAGCSDFTKYKGSYLHIAYTGSTKFTVAFQQHNKDCNADIAPYPETWDSAEASRYASNGHIYIPINHFKIDLTRVVGFALKGFYSSDPVTLSTIEIVSSVPVATTVPAKADTGNLIFACKRPNSFAFAIDDGIPSLAQDVLKIIREENIKVTFFTVGAPLVDSSTNLTNVYREMQAAGHQLALHSFTHPKMESLPDNAAIDWEYNEDIKAMKNSFDGLDTPYFRPPFGNEGARMRSRLSKAVGPKATIVNWSVDVEDWLWAETNTPEKQKDAFQRDVNKGGNLVVLHYLYPSTVSYLREFIQIAKKSGKQLMRVDQCMEDPSAPPL